MIKLLYKIMYFLLDIRCGIAPWGLITLVVHWLEIYVLLKSAARIWPQDNTIEPLCSRWTPGQHNPAPVQQNINPGQHNMIPDSIICSLVDPQWNRNSGFGWIALDDFLANLWNPNYKTISKRLKRIQHDQNKSYKAISKWRKQTYGPWPIWASAHMGQFHMG